MLFLSHLLFGPLDKLYCIYFYILSVIGILFGIFLCILCFIYPIFLKTSMIISMFILSFLIYFQNRLLFQMCIDKLYKETFKPLSDNQTATKDITDMKTTSGAIKGINSIIDQNPIFGAVFTGARDAVTNEIDTNAGQIYNSVNTLTSKDEVDPAIIAKFTNNSIDVTHNPKFWSNYANQVKQAIQIQNPDIKLQSVISENGSRKTNCSKPVSCPVSGDSPFCTSTGWACPHMWTSNVQKYGSTSSSQIDPSVLTYN